MVQPSATYLVGRHNAQYSLSTPLQQLQELLGEIISHHGLRYLQYADDTQLCISNPGGPSDAGVALWQWGPGAGGWGQQISTEPRQD